jgi:hypothetical protein
MLLHEQLDILVPTHWLSDCILLSISQNSVSEVYKIRGLGLMLAMPSLCHIFVVLRACETVCLFLLAG